MLNEFVLYGFKRVTMVLGKFISYPFD